MKNTTFRYYVIMLKLYNILFFATTENNNSSTANFMFKSQLNSVKIKLILETKRIEQKLQTVLNRFFSRLYKHVLSETEFLKNLQKLKYRAYISKNLIANNV